MTDLSVSVTIQNGSDSLADIPLTRANGFIIVSLSRGIRTPDVGAVDSLWIDGDVTTRKRFPRMHGQIAVRAVKDTYPLARAALLTVRAAVEQDSYEIVVDVEGDSETWHCTPASSGEGSIDGEFDQTEAVHRRQTLYLTDIPYLKA